MVKVLLWGSLADLADGTREVAVEAATLRDLLDGLARSAIGME